MFLSQIIKKQQAYQLGLGLKPTPAEPPKSAPKTVITKPELAKAENISLPIAKEKTPKAVVKKPVQVIPELEEVAPNSELVESEAVAVPEIPITPEPEVPVVTTEPATPDLTDSGIFPLSEAVQEPLPPPPESSRPITAPLNSQDILKLDLENIFKHYAIPAKVLKTMETKMMGVPVPVELHERMNAFIQKNKGLKNAPTSLKELALICIQQSMDNIEKKK